MLPAHIETPTSSIWRLLCLHYELSAQLHVSLGRSYAGHIADNYLLACYLSHYRLSWSSPLFATSRLANLSNSILRGEGHNSLNFFPSFHSDGAVTFSAILQISA